MHFVGEVEVVFGLWAVVLMVALTVAKGWDVAKHYVNDGVTYTEPLFVVVIMALAATRPIITFAEGAHAAGGRDRAEHAGGLVAGDPDHSARCSGRSSPSRRR